MSVILNLLHYVRVIDEFDYNFLDLLFDMDTYAVQFLMISLREKWKRESSSLNDLKCKEAAYWGVCLYMYFAVTCKASNLAN